MATEENDRVPKLPPDARLDSLEERLERVQRIEAQRTHKVQPDPNVRIGQQVLGHLIGGPAGGVIIGLGLDYWFGTKPLFMILMLLLGFGVGVRNVIRITKSPPNSGRGA